MALGLILSWPAAIAGTLSVGQWCLVIKTFAIHHSTKNNNAGGGAKIIGGAAAVLDGACASGVGLRVKTVSLQAVQPRLAALRERLATEAKEVKEVNEAPKRKPEWLKVASAGGPNYERLRATVREKKLATVCEEARCPNIGECWEGRDSAAAANGEKHTATATIMVMGDTCTRGCRFCSVKTSRAPPALDPEEPRKTAEAVASWGLDYIVITSVDRDDLADHGSSHLAQTVQAIKVAKPSMLVELLSPDFGGNLDFVDRVAGAGLEVFAHNIETVERLTARVRDRRAGYAQTLRVLDRAKAQSDVLTKTSIMLGFGETDEEVLTTMKDLRNVGCDVVTFGQYLQPTKRHIKIYEYVEPAKFDHWKAEADAMGFKYCASGPLVRSSYRAGELFVTNMLRNKQK